MVKWKVWALVFGFAMGGDTLAMKQKIFICPRLSLILT